MPALPSFVSTQLDSCDMGGLAYLCKMWPDPIKCCSLTSIIHEYTFKLGSYNCRYVYTPTEITLLVTGGSPPVPTRDTQRICTGANHRCSDKHLHYPANRASQVMECRIQAPRPVKQSEYVPKAVLLTADLPSLESVRSCSLPGV
jgi:hypothetical protein